ncbi:MAG: polysaccharide deacetylase family protein [Pseudoxanthomonas sp.]
MSAFVASMVERKPLLLTIDDAPENEGLDRQMLAILAKHHAHAIWFINCKYLDPATDSQAAEHQAVLNEIAKQGHLLGNHSYNHLNLTALDPTRLQHEIGDCSEMIHGISGVSPGYFRPPFGSHTPRVKDVAEKNGMQMVLWSLNSYDSMLASFKTHPGQYAQLLETNQAYDIPGQADAGDILLMHDYPNTAATLDATLSRLEKKGFVFVVPTSAH